MNINGLKKDEFLDLNVEIITELKRSFRKKHSYSFKSTIKEHYARFSIKSFELYYIAIFATGNEVTIEASSSCIDNSSNDKVSYCYSTRKDVEDKEKAKQNYINKSIAYFTALFNYAEHLCYCIEWYNWDYDWERIIKAFVMNNNVVSYKENAGWDYYANTLGSSNGIYMLNAFIAYPASYINSKQLLRHTKFLENLSSALEAVPFSRVISPFKEYYVGTDTKNIENEVINKYKNGLSCSAIYEKTHSCDNLTLSKVRSIIRKYKKKQEITA